MLRIGVALGAALLVAGGAVACPDQRAEAVAAYRASVFDLDETARLEVVAGGDHDIGNCPGSFAIVEQGGGGFFTESPDFSFDISGLGDEISGYRWHLDFNVVSECDATMLISIPGGHFYYDDDDHGNLDPQIRFTRPRSGLYQVWVGTHDGSFCNAVLSVTSIKDY